VISARQADPQIATCAEKETVMKDAAREKRRGIVWTTAGIAFLALMFGAWWLVESTNREGTHDAQLLPFFALIPLGIGAYHLVRSRLHHA
jgi:hypothetical protein